MSGLRWAVRGMVAVSVIYLGGLIVFHLTLAMPWWAVGVFSVLGFGGLVCAVQLHRQERWWAAHQERDR